MMVSPKKPFAFAAQNLKYVGIANIAPYSNWLKRQLGIDLDATGAIQPVPRGIVFVTAPPTFGPAQQAAFFGTLNAALNADVKSCLHAVAFATGFSEADLDNCRQINDAVRARCPSVVRLGVSAGSAARLDFDGLMVPASIAGSFPEDAPVDIYGAEMPLPQLLALQVGATEDSLNVAEYDLKPVRRILFDMTAGTSANIAAPPRQRTPIS